MGSKEGRRIWSEIQAAPLMVVLAHDQLPRAAWKLNRGGLFRTFRGFRAFGCFGLGRCFCLLGLFWHRGFGVFSCGCV